MHHTIIPVFHELQITSTYEYLQTRFDRKVRLFGSIMFTMATIFWMPIVSGASIESSSAHLIASFRSFTFRL